MVEKTPTLGFKQTELGPIPEDWEVRELREVGTFSKGRGIKKNDILPSGIPCIRYGEIYTHYNDFIRNFISFISSEVARDSKRLHKGDLLFTGSGENEEEIGKCVAFLGNEEAYAGGDIIVFSQEGQDSMFLGYLMNSRPIIEQKASMSQGEVIVHIHSGNLGRLRIPLPPRDEQGAIAKVLADLDSLIERFDDLVAKKDNIKLGVMQELLSGRRRLPGFNEEWKTRTLVELTSCLDNLRVPLNEAQRLVMQGGYPYCGANGILDFVNDFVIDDDVILIAEDGGYFEEYATRPIAYKMSGKIWVNNHAHVLKARQEFSQDFIFYSLVHKNILRFIVSGTRAKLNRSEMNRIEIDLPVSKREQDAIAQTLSDMDEEV